MGRSTEPAAPKLWARAMVPYANPPTTGVGNVVVHDFPHPPTAEAVAGLQELIGARIGQRACDIIILGWFEMAGAVSDVT